MSRQLTPLFTKLSSSVCAQYFAHVPSPTRTKVSERGSIFLITILCCFSSCASAAQAGSLAHHSFWETLMRFFSLQDTALQTALWGVLLLGISCGVLGSFILVRKLSLMGDALSHAVLPGVAAGFLWTYEKNPLIILLGALLTGLLGSAAVGWLTQRTKIKTDAAIGMVLSGFYAVGICLMTYIQKLPTGNKSGLDHFLFGQVAALSTQDIWLMGSVTIGVLVGVFICYRAFLILSFDMAFGKSLGLPMKALHYTMMLLLAFAVVVGLQAVGVVLVSAMLIIPAATAYLLTDQMKVLLPLAAFIGIVTAFIGAFLSFVGDGLPTGPLMVLSAGFVFATVFCFSPKHGWLTRVIRHYLWRRQVARENALKGVYQLMEAEQFKIEGIALDDLALRRHLPIPIVKKHVRMLFKLDLVTIDKVTEKIYLTPEGWHIACSVVRKHRLWELYLTQECHMASDAVHEDAEEIEHMIGEDTVRALEKRLKFPNKDPHGRLIPSIQDMWQSSSYKVTGADEERSKDE